MDSYDQITALDLIGIVRLDNFYSLIGTKRVSLTGELELCGMM
jgi:hypothetical protein